MRGVRTWRSIRVRSYVLPLLLGALALRFLIPTGFMPGGAKAPTSRGHVFDRKGPERKLRNPWRTCETALRSLHVALAGLAVGAFQHRGPPAHARKRSFRGSSPRFLRLRSLERRYPEPLPAPDRSGSVPGTPDQHARLTPQACRVSSRARGSTCFAHFSRCLPPARWPRPPMPINTPSAAWSSAIHGPGPRPPECRPASPIYPSPTTALSRTR